MRSAKRACFGPILTVLAVCGTPNAVAGPIRLVDYVYGFAHSDGAAINPFYYSHPNQAWITGDPVTASQWTVNDYFHDGDSAEFEVSSSGALSASLDGSYTVEDLGYVPIDITLDRSTAGFRDGEVRISNPSDSSDLDEAFMLPPFDYGYYDTLGRPVDPASTGPMAFYDAANASFDPEADIDELTIDLGTHSAGTGTVTETFDIWNLESASDFTAALTGRHTFGPSGTSYPLHAPSLVADIGATTIEPGMSESFQVGLDLSAPGDYATTWTISLIDGIPGTGEWEYLGGATEKTLRIRAEGSVVAAVPAPPAVYLLGTGLLFLGLSRLAERRSPRRHNENTRSAFV